MPRSSIIFSNLPSGSPLLTKYGNDVITAPTIGIFLGDFTSLSFLVFDRPG
jgi:hypothetical protein